MRYLLVLNSLFLYTVSSYAATLPVPYFNFVRPATNPQEVAVTLEILLLLTVLSVAPGILIMTTSFVRIIIVLSFIRRALATQEMPPNQVIMGLGLILTFMVMSPTWQEVNKVAIQPYIKGKINQFEAFKRALGPVRKFMFEHTRKKDLGLFIKIAGLKGLKTRADVPTEVLIPAFVISELKRAFVMGFLIYIPFLIVDMIVASVLLAMGMLMLPPIMVSLPFKILLFILVDGWNLVIGSLVKSFY